jgi:hypothetical protein
MRLLAVQRRIDIGTADDDKPVEAIKHRDIRVDVGGQQDHSRPGLLEEIEVPVREN